jgi:hypothetical protein
MVYNSKLTREWFLQEDAASSTAALESIIIKGVIKGKEMRGILTCNTANAFIQVGVTASKET